MTNCEHCAGPNCEALDDDTGPPHSPECRAAMDAQLAEIASQPVCATCGGNGMVGGLTPHSGYDAIPCPDCAEKYA